jgi:5-(carboxyamino)imidazole ribonucleotide mutase
VAKKATEVLTGLGMTYRVSIASAHRTPDLVEKEVRSSGAKVFIAIAGLSAALPGVVASHTLRPVIGVPVSGSLNLDSILSILQMPPGVPVAAVGLDRGENAALLAARIVALGSIDVAKALESYRQRMRENVLASSKEVQL